MKKLLVFAFAAGLLVSCGPSAEEKAAAEKMRQDSIQSVMDKMTADSLAAVQAMVEQARMDSIAMVAKNDSIAKAEMAGKKSATAKPKTKPKAIEPVKTEVPKVGMKRPGAK